MRTFVGLMLLFFGIIGLVWFYDNHIRQEWMGIAESRTSNNVLSINFGSKSECIAWLNNVRSNPGGYENHECGLNCKVETSGIYVCKETI